ncbi:hypothetical protein [Marinobacterium jannaschii]|uniref:hypothetical protein n=1 Tax=Marinobacterium jannaschii TaxID=64970 RepID=UPI000486D054|nr:hypothetical protein [Marinobacterium jannaschii]
MSKLVKQLTQRHRKRQRTGLLLAALLGPLGLVYSSWAASLLLTIIAMAGGYSWTIPAVCWGFSLIISPWLVLRRNRKLQDSIRAFTRLS